MGNENVWFYIFGIALSAGGAWLTALTVVGFNMWTKVTQIQTAMILISKKAADLLHSPTDHLGIDYYVDKYRKNHHELSLQEWIEFMNECKRIMDDSTVEKNSQFLASLVFNIEVCLHKQMNVSNFEKPKDNAK